MQSNKLRMAIRATAAVVVLGVAGQVGAVELNPKDLNFKAEVYGFARVAASYDINENIKNGGQAANLAKLTDADVAEGHFGIDAKTSRLGVKVSAAEGVTAVVEFDFDRDNSLTPRLRQAYGEYKGVLMGQTWSNYSSFVGSTSVLDFDGLRGNAGVQGRVAQMRYTTGPLSFSLEEQVSSDVATIGGAKSADTKQGLPVLTARLEDSQGGLSYSVAAMAKQVAIDNGTSDDSVLGYGVFAAGSVAVTDMISIQGALNYTDGAAGYIFGTGNNGFWGYDAYTDASGDLETVESFGANIGAGFSLGGGRSINIGYGIAQQDLDDGVAASSVAGTDTETNSMMVLNYQWSPVKAVKMGVEYARIERESQNGDEADANRVMFLAQYNF
jgi:hypothetical protein